MKSVTVVVAGRLDARTGGSIYNRRMAEELQRQGWRVEVRELDESFPFPGEKALRHAAEVFAQIPAGWPVLVDGLAFGALPDIARDAADRLTLVPIVHLPLAAAVRLKADVAARLAASERSALQSAALVVVTGTCTAGLMAEHGMGHERIVVVEPGTDPAPLATGSNSDVLHLLTVGTLNPGKGHEILLDALASLDDRRWHLTCAGNLTRYPSTAGRVREVISCAGLDAQVTLCGELDGPGLAACYDRADVFVLASLRETYGMAVAEALARGLPVVATATGAIPNLLGDGAGLVVPPGDRAALAAAITEMMDPSRRAAYAEAARRVRERLHDWSRAAGQLAAVLEGVASHG